MSQVLRTTKPKRVLRTSTRRRHPLQQTNRTLQQNVPLAGGTRSPGDREWKSGIREVLIGVGAAALIAFLGVAYTTITDDRRAEQAERLENLRFIRERSDEKLETPRPFKGMDLQIFR